MKIHGNFVVRLETVRNSYRGVRIAEVRLYCNSVLVDFFSFFFLYLFLGIGQTQSIDNIFKEFFPFFSSHGNLCTTMSESWLVELMQSVGMVQECLNAFFFHIQWIERDSGRHKFRVTTRGRTKHFVGEWLSKVDCISSHKNVAFC